VRVLPFCTHHTQNLAAPPGRVVELSHGKCHYILTGEHNPGPLVVLIHGFIGSSAYFKWLADHLVTKHNRRVLRYDNYGRGWSGCSGAPHTASLFAGQLAELLYTLNEAPSAKIDLVGPTFTHLHFVVRGWGYMALLHAAVPPCGVACAQSVHGDENHLCPAKIHVTACSYLTPPLNLQVGYSMGGAIASKFAATYGAEKLQSLILLASAGHGAMDKTLPWWLLARFLQVPVLPQMLARQLVPGAYFANPLRDWETPTGCAHTDEYLATEEARGHNEPALSQSIVNTLQHFTMGAANEPSFAAIGKTELPTLMVWGKMDTVVPYTGAAIIAGLVPHATLVTLEAGMHCMVIERPTEVAEIMVEWWANTN
jgi:pimeloyl-ACP methyl ester carboxylesterase